jgi:hypothetical protein
MDETAVEKLKALGVRGILLQLAEHRQIVDVRCEMPQCYCHRGPQALRSEAVGVRVVTDA